MFSPKAQLSRARLLLLLLCLLLGCASPFTPTAPIIHSSSRQEWTGKESPSWTGLRQSRADEYNLEFDDFDDDEEIEYGKFSKGPDDDEEIEYGKFSKGPDDDDEIEYGKFSAGTDDDAFPSYMSDDSEPPQATSWSASPQADETQRRMEEQQRQIDQLMKLVQQQQQQQQAPADSIMGDDTMHRQQHVAPLKAMLFIDGTWLYYSLHERSEDRCEIVRKYGRAWFARYNFDWTALPRIICGELQKQQHMSSGRPVEIVRASVYTSCKKDTWKYSNRIRMFEEMKAANYDVFMMETVGPGEKCVDIQLAVEMLHYATVPNAYDVAILLSGDKDFMPAMIRTRQKGRKVGLVSMRSGCNRALFETPNVKDYDVVWIEDFMDQLLVPKEGTDRPGLVSVFTITKVIYDFIDTSGLKQVSSRDIGRYLKQVNVGGQPLLDETKRMYGGLYQFVTVSSCFDVTKRTAQDERKSQKVDPFDKTFWVSLHEGADQLLLEEAKRSHFSEEEKDFFDKYSLSRLEDGSTAYEYTRQLMGGASSSDASFVRVDGQSEVAPLELPEELTRDYTSLKLTELKEVCRERGLRVSGVKAALIERIQNDVEQEIAELKQQHQEKTAVKRPGIPERINGGGPQHHNGDADQYLEGLVKEYIQARGGEASSRDVGRYLAANAPSGHAGTHSLGGGTLTALSELKGLYGGLAAYISQRPDSFVRKDAGSPSSTSFEFNVALRNGPN